MPSASSYRVKEIFGPTIQGEGAHAGAACVFLRFAACNLACTWCDTDFAPEGAARMSAEAIVEALRGRDAHGARMVVVTGGEPALQWDAALADGLAAAGFRVHMESNGTRPLAASVDWLTVSPKPQFHRARDRLLGPDELPIAECKVVVDDTVDDAALAGYEQLYGRARDTVSESRTAAGRGCDHWFVQPCMDERYQHHLARTLALIERRPRWRLSLQLHKIAGVP